jgi:hypothetical protein
VGYMLYDERYEKVVVRGVGDGVGTGGNNHLYSEDLPINDDTAGK